MALLAADIPNSKAKGKRLKPEAGYVAAYTREFELSKPYGSSQLLYINSEVRSRFSEDDDRRHCQLPEVPPLDAGPPVAREQHRRAARHGTSKKDVTIGKLRTPPIGDEAVLVSLSVRTTEGRFYAAHLMA